MTFPSNHLELRYFESICSPDTRSCSLGVLSSSAAMAGIMSKTGIELTSVWSNVIGTREVCTSDEFLQLLHTIQSTSITPIEIQHEIPCIEEVDIAFRNVAVNGRVSLKKYIRHIPRVQSLLNSGLVTREEIDLLWADIAGEAGSVDYAGYTTMNEGVEACVIGSLDVNSMRNEWLDEVWIRASDVAACIGLNQYKSSEEALEEVWGRYAPHTQAPLTRDAEALRLIQKEDTGQLHALVQSTLQQVSTGVRGSSEVIDLIAKSIASLPALSSKLDPTEQSKIAQYIQSASSQMHGTRNERVTAQAIQQMDASVEVREDDSYYRAHVLSSSTHLYTLVGRVDRIEVDGTGERVLVEIKNRMRRLFYTVPPYEYVQVQVYLYLLDLQRAKLVEQFNDEVNTMLIARDEAYIQGIVLPGLRAFVTRLDALLSDGAARDAYLASRQNFS